MKTLSLMKSVTSTYPRFHELPKGVKQMLLISESFFFGEARSAPGVSDPRFNVGFQPQPSTAFPTALHETLGPSNSQIISTVSLDCGGKYDAATLSDV